MSAISSSSSPVKRKREESDETSSKKERTDAADSVDAGESEAASENDAAKTQADAEKVDSADAPTLGVEASDLKYGEEAPAGELAQAAEEKEDSEDKQPETNGETEGEKEPVPKPESLTGGGEAEQGPADKTEAKPSAEFSKESSETSEAGTVSKESTVADVASTSNEAAKAEEPKAKPKFGGFAAFAKSSPFAATAGKPSVFGSTPAASSSTTTPKTSAFTSFASASSPFASVKKPQVSALDTQETTSTTDATAATEDKKESIYKQVTDTATGEEDEEIIRSVRGKLYAMHDGHWAERGQGNIKLYKSPAGSFRLVMRAEQTLRLLLNSPLFAEFTVQITADKYIKFVVIENNVPVSYMFKAPSSPTAQDLITHIEEAVAELK